MGHPNSKLSAFTKGAFTEGMGGLAAAVVNPETWSGTSEEIVARFGRGFVDNIMSAGAEGLGEHIGAASRRKAAAHTQKRLADTGVGNTAVVGGHVLDLDTGRVHDGESGAPLGTIDIDPATGMVYDVSDPAARQPIGVNPHLVGTRVGGMDATDAPAVAAAEQVSHRLAVGAGRRQDRVERRSGGRGRVAARDRGHLDRLRNAHSELAGSSRPPRTGRAAQPDRARSRSRSHARPPAGCS